MRCCFPALRAPRSLPKQAIRASRSRRDSSTGSVAGKPRTTRSASPLPAAPGVSPPCCASPTLLNRRPNSAARPRVFRRLAEYLDRAVEGHQASLDGELGMVLGDRRAELGQHLAVGLGLDLRIGDAALAIGDPGGAAIAVVDRDDPR